LRFCIKISRFDREFGQFCGIVWKSLRVGEFVEESYCCEEVLEEEFGGFCGDF